MLTKNPNFLNKKNLELFVARKNIDGYLTPVEIVWPENEDAMTTNCVHHTTNEGRVYYEDLLTGFKYVKLPVSIYEKNGVELVRVGTGYFEVAHDRKYIHSVEVSYVVKYFQDADFKFYHP